MAGGSNWNRLSLVMMGAGFAALVAAVVLFTLQLVGVSDVGGKSGPDTGTAFNAAKFLEAPPPPPPTPTGVPPSDAPVVRLVIPKIGVDAPVQVKSVDPDGVMQAPDGPWNVAWYDFSSKPGFGGNVVFSGHVDYHNVGPAVFWDLGDLDADDVIEVRLEDGTVYRYRVVAKEAFDASSAPIERIVGPTPVESVTIITCTGTFDASTRQYDRRLVVRAERVVEPAGGPSAAGAGS